MSKVIMPVAWAARASRSELDKKIDNARDLDHNQALPWLPGTVHSIYPFSTPLTKRARLF